MVCSCPYLSFNIIQNNIILLFSIVPRPINTSIATQIQDQLFKTSETKKKSRSARRSIAFQRIYSTKQDQHVNNILQDTDIQQGIKDLKHWMVYDKDITIDFDNNLGEGQFGKVYPCWCKNIKSAVKILEKEKIEKENIMGFINEAKLLLSLQHRNILRLVGCQFSEKIICVLTEECTR